MKKNNLFPKLSQTVENLDPTSISEERKKVLLPLVDYIREKVDTNTTIRLNFICTHNSRRSHLSQIWAQTLAYHLGLENVYCYSGGTEATAMFPKVAETLSGQGFQILKLSETTNPVYGVKYDSVVHPIICFSKTYDDDFNPQSDFAAIMTCDSANEACPIVLGSEARFPITYQDPKAFDGTPQQDKKYAERSIQIATEMFFVLTSVTK